MQNTLMQFVRMSYLDTADAEDVYQNKAEEVWKQKQAGKVRQFWSCLHRAAQFGQHRHARSQVKQAQRQLPLSTWDSAVPSSRSASSGSTRYSLVPLQLCVGDAEAMMIAQEEEQAFTVAKQSKVKAIQDAVMTLTPYERTIYLLGIVQGGSSVEIGAALGKEAATVRKLKSKVKRKLTEAAHKRLVS